MANATDGTMLLQLPTDRLVLQELHEGGRNLGANIADKIDRHRKTVTKRLNQLEDYGLVLDVGRGVYEITERGEIALEHIDEYDRESDRLEEVIERELTSNGTE